MFEENSCEFGSSELGSGDGSSEPGAAEPDSGDPSFGDPGSGERGIGETLRKTLRIDHFLAPELPGDFLVCQVSSDAFDKAVFNLCEGVC